MDVRKIILHFKKCKHKRIKLVWLLIIKNAMFLEHRLTTENIEINYSFIAYKSMRIMQLMRDNFLTLEITIMIKSLIPPDIMFSTL